jgi:hypothetical protein
LPIVVVERGVDASSTTRLVRLADRRHSALVIRAFQMRVALALLLGELLVLFAGAPTQAHSCSRGTTVMDVDASRTQTVCVPPRAEATDSFDAAASKHLVYAPDVRGSIAPTAWRRIDIDGSELTIVSHEISIARARAPPALG